MNEILQNIAHALRTLSTHASANVSSLGTRLYGDFLGALSGSLKEVLLFAIEIFVLVFIVRVLYMGIMLAWFVFDHIKPIGHIPQPYSNERLNGKKILVVGDSTAFGTGADKPEDTISGRLSHDFPGTEIRTRAKNGAVTEEVLAQLRKEQANTFDMVLVFTGGNDVWRFTNIKKLSKYLSELLQLAQKMSNGKVIVLFYANFKHPPSIPSFLRGILQNRTQVIRSIFLEVTSSLDVPCVEIYTEEQRKQTLSDPFSKDPARYLARDLVHPNSEGYRLWYNRMWLEMVNRKYFFEEREEKTPMPISR